MMGWICLSFFRNLAVKNVHGEKVELSFLLSFSKSAREWVFVNYFWSWRDCMIHLTRFCSLRLRAVFLLRQRCKSCWLSFFKGRNVEISVSEETYASRISQRDFSRITFCSLCFLASTSVKFASREVSTINDRDVSYIWSFERLA